MGGARQLLNGFPLYQSSLSCNDEERSSRKEGRHLGGFAGKSQTSGSCWEEQKGWEQALERGCCPHPSVPSSYRVLSPTQDETLVQRPSLKYGAALPARDPTEPVLL